MTTTTSSVPALALPFPVTPRQDGAQSPDLSDLALAHRALRTGTRLLADALAGIVAGAGCSRERHEAVVWFTGHVLHEVAEHHRKEDDILWPVVAASVGAEVDLDALSDEYGVLNSVLGRADDALRTFVTHAEVGAPALAAVLIELADDLDEHTAAEEARFFPVIREYVSVHDFDRVRARFARHNPYAHLLFMLSWLGDLAAPDERGAIRVPLRARPGLRRRQQRWQQRRDLVAGV